MNMTGGNDVTVGQRVRNDYRRWLFLKRVNNADNAAPTVVDQIAGDADGLMPIGKIGAPLNVTIPLWPDRPPVPTLTNTLNLDWRPVTVPESEFQSFHSEEVPGPDTLPDSDFPLSRAIPLHVFEHFEGKFEFRYRVKNWNSDAETNSVSAPVTIDRTGPIRPGIPGSIIVTEPLITTAILEADGGIKCEIPAFVEDKIESVLVAVALLDTPPTVPVPPEELALVGLLPADRKILIPKDLVYGLGSMLQYIVYILFDKAGNRSDMPFPTPVQVALGALPANLVALKVPLADDGLIDRADAALPTTVVIEEYTNSNRDDGVVIKWGTKEIARTSVGPHLPFPLNITVPWLHMRGEYDFDAGGGQVTEVDYVVLRGDYPTASPGGITVNVDLAIPGPDNPDPEPTNPALGLVRFESSRGSADELTIDDINQPATGHIKLPQSLLEKLEVGDVLTLYWNTVPVTSGPYTFLGTETANQELPITIPWADIEKTPVIDRLPMHYTLTRAGFKNPQESERTYIKVMVEVVDLPEPTFPDKVGVFPLNCDALIEKNGAWGVRVHIPVSAHLKETVDVKASWKTYGKNKVELPNTDLDEVLTVSEEEEAGGIDWFIPYDKHLKPTYDTGDQYGYGRVSYSINIRGADVSSDLVEEMIAVFEHGGHCVIPRP